MEEEEDAYKEQLDPPPEGSPPQEGSPPPEESPPPALDHSDLPGAGITAYPAPFANMRRYRAQQYFRVSCECA